MVVLANNAIPNVYLRIFKIYVYIYKKKKWKILVIIYEERI